jgi:hypothetical protein
MCWFIFINIILNQFFLNIIYIMKLNSAVSKFLTNKWVLNLVAALALFNVIGYMVIGNINSILYFIVFSVLVRYFSKNMTIVLGVPLLIVNLLAMRGNILEGMENNTNTSNKPEQPKKDQKKIDDIVNKNKNKPDPKTGQGLPMQPLEQDSDNTNVATQSTGGEQQGIESVRRKNRGYDIYYATTIEDAYDELNNILGGDGIQRLTSDTQGLMKQQMQLAEAMKNIEPMVQSMVPMVNQLKGMMGQMDDGKEGLGGIMKMAQQFTSKPAPSN